MMRTRTLSKNHMFNENNRTGLISLIEAAEALVHLNQIDSSVSINVSNLEKNRAVLVTSDEDGEGSTNNKTPPPTATNSTKNKRTNFPRALMAMVNDDTVSDVIAWLPHGHSFAVFQPDVLMENVLPKYLPPVDSAAATKYSSFTRKLNRWGFRQQTRGPENGAFYHPLFRRDRPELSLNMECQRTRDRGKRETPKQTSSARKKLPVKKRSSATTTDDNSTVSSSPAKEPLNKILPPRPLPKESQTARKCANVATDSHSVVTSSSTSTSSLDFRSITTDEAVIQAALQKRDELERMRIAKALLYQSYVRAVRNVKQTSLLRQQSN